jgi:hypothetical protein
MQRSAKLCQLTGLLLVVLLSAVAQQNKPGVLTADEIKHLAPSGYFFAGQSATVQTRNTVGFRNANGKLTLAGLVDTSGYASDVANKYQGFFLTEGKLKIAGSELQAGQYGFGFSKDGKFTIMNVAAEEILSASYETDDKLIHPVPLKVVEDADTYKLYAGKKFVTLKAE